MFGFVIQFTFLEINKTSSVFYSYVQISDPPICIIVAGIIEEHCIAEHDLRGSLVAVVATPTPPAPPTPPSLQEAPVSPSLAEAPASSSGSEVGPSGGSRSR